MADRNALHLQLSLMQVMKLVVFCAVALACVAPMFRVWERGALPGHGRIATGIFVVIYSAVAVPLVWAALSFVLVRRSLWRDRLIFSLLLCSVSVALASTVWILYTGVSVIIGNPPGAVDTQEMLGDLSLVGVVTLVLAAAFLFLTSRLLRKYRCESRGDDQPQPSA